MGTTLTVLSPLRKSTWSKVLENASKFNYGKPFVEMVKEHPVYGRLMEAKGGYEVKLVHLESSHWRLLVRTKDSTMPYISLEIRSTDLSDLVQFIREVDSLQAGVSSDVGVYEGTLLSLCELADGVVREMGSYDLLCSNCQTFCNKLLKKMGKREFPTSTELLDRSIDLLGEALAGKPPARKGTSYLSMSKLHATCTTQKQSRSMAVKATANQTASKEVDLALPKNVPSLSIDDLGGLHKILIPLEGSWKIIGERLNVGAQVLDTIESEYQSAKQCLREMLRKYLQRTDPPPLWKDLVNAVGNVEVARSIVRRAERIPSTAL